MLTLRGNNALTLPSRFMRRELSARVRGTWLDSHHDVFELEMGGL